LIISISRWYFAKINSVKKQRMDGWMDDCLGGHCAAAMPDLTKASFSHEKLFPPTD